MVHVRKLEGFYTSKKGVTCSLFSETETLPTPFYPFAFAAMGLLLCVELISEMDR